MVKANELSQLSPKMNSDLSDDYAPSCRKYYFSKYLAFQLKLKWILWARWRNTEFRLLHYNVNRRWLPWCITLHYVPHKINRRLRKEQSWSMGMEVCAAVVEKWGDRFLATSRFPLWNVLFSDCFPWYSFPPYHTPKPRSSPNYTFLRKSVSTRNLSQS